MMIIRHTEECDKPAVMEIYANARAFMAASGNPNQWEAGYPSTDQLARDMADGRSYVCEEKGVILATFMMSVEPDPTYAVIEGAWINDEPYATLHRVASAGIRAGMMDEIVRWAFSFRGNLRADTHELNAPMKRALLRNGFEECGIIHLLDGRPRIAYQKVR